MSKSAKKYAEELSDRIAARREGIKRLLREYRDAVRSEESSGFSVQKVRKQREMERAVGEYLRLCKAFDRVQRGKARA